MYSDGIIKQIKKMNLAINVLQLHPEIKLTGNFAESSVAIGVDDVMSVIDAALKEELDRRRFEEERDLEE